MTDRKAKKGFRPPKAESWMTTDEEERSKRRERASAEPMKVKAVDASDGFGRYEVSHPAADRRTVVYHVEIRDLDASANTCDCPDFIKSGLGTCKHIERVLKTVARKCGTRRRCCSRRSRTSMESVDSETLDLAVNGSDLPNAIQRVRHFIDECRSAM